MPATFSNPTWKVERDAAKLLEANKIVAPEIWRVDSIVILFSQEGEAWTAWLSADRKTIDRLDRGFVAEY